MKAAKRECWNVECVLGRLLEVTMHLAFAAAGAFFAGGMIYAIRECWYVPENGNYRVGYIFRVVSYNPR